MWKILTALLLIKSSNITYIQDDGVVDRDFVWKIDDTVNWKNFMADAENFTKRIMQKAQPRLLNFLSSVNVSNQCAESLIAYSEGIRKWEPWAIQMVDATARLPSGQLMVTKIDFGSLEECLAVKKEGHGKEIAFQGQFCMLGYKSPLLAPMHIKTPHGKDYIEAYGQPPEWILQMMKKQAGLLRSFGLWLGTCIPSTCSRQDIRMIFSRISKPYASLVSVTDCQVDSRKEFPTSAKIACCVLLVLFGISTLGTIFDIRGRKSTNEKEISENFFIQQLKAFSLVANTEKLFETSTRKSPLDNLHGIRVLLCLWVIIAHSMLYPEYWKEIKYSSYGESHKFKNKGLVIFENTLLMECFSMISGFLLVFSMQKKNSEKKGGKVEITKITKIFFRKYFRFMPGFLFILMLLYILPVTSSGPIWNSTWEFEHRRCTPNWWKNMFLLNNFFGLDDNCFFHFWYVSFAVQAFLFGFFLMILTYRYPKLGVLLGVSVISISSYIDYRKILFYQFRSLSVYEIKDFRHLRTFIFMIYLQPLHHIGSFMVGMVLGIIFDKQKEFNPSKIILVFGWIISIISALALICFVRLPISDVKIAAYYISIRNCLFAISCAWQFYCCLTGNAGILTRILSHKFLVPFSKLTYMVYLVHPIVIYYKEAARHERFFLSMTDLAFELCGYIVFSLVISYIGYITVEIPCSSICDNVMKSSSSKELKEHSTTKTKILGSEKAE